MKLNHLNENYNDLEDQDEFNQPSRPIILLANQIQIHSTENTYNITTQLPTNTTLKLLQIEANNIGIPHPPKNLTPKQQIDYYTDHIGHQSRYNPDTKTQKINLPRLFQYVQSSR